MSMTPREFHDAVLEALKADGRVHVQVLPEHQLPDELPDKIKALAYAGKLDFIGAHATELADRVDAQPDRERYAVELAAQQLVAARVPAGDAASGILKLYPEGVAVVWAAPADNIIDRHLDDDRKRAYPHDGFAAVWDEPAGFYRHYQIRLLCAQAEAPLDYIRLTTGQAMALRAEAWDVARVARFEHSFDLHSDLAKRAWDVSQTVFERHGEYPKITLIGRATMTHPFIQEADPTTGEFMPCNDEADLKAGLLGQWRGHDIIRLRNHKDAAYDNVFPANELLVVVDSPDDTREVLALVDDSIGADLGQKS